MFDSGVVCGTWSNYGSRLWRWWFHPKYQINITVLKCIPCCTNTLQSLQTFWHILIDFNHSFSNLSFLASRRTMKTTRKSKSSKATASSGSRALIYRFKYLNKNNCVFDFVLCYKSHIFSVRNLCKRAVLWSTPLRQHVSVTAILHGRTIR